MERKRHKQKPLRKLFNKFRYMIEDIKHSRQNADAAYSARYILEDLQNKEGIEKLSEITGLPEGVISAALKNIVR